MRLFFVLSMVFMSKSPLHASSDVLSCIVASDLVSIHEACDESSSFATQAIYGETLAMIEELGDGWSLVQARDGTRGFCKRKALSTEQLNRASMQVSSMAGMVYSIPDTKRPALMRLPYGARVDLIDPYEGSDARWLKMRLIGGKEAWIQRGDVERLEQKSLEQVIEIAKSLLGIPYIWGGNSSFGYDCSGFVQTLFKQMGLLLPRNARDQALDPRLESVSQPELPGDLIFFGKDQITHVGIYLGDQQFINAGVSDHQPRVYIASIHATKYHCLSVKRLKVLY